MQERAREKMPWSGGLAHVQGQLLLASTKPNGENQGREYLLLPYMPFMCKMHKAWKLLYLNLTGRS